MPKLLSTADYNALVQRAQSFDQIQSALGEGHSADEIIAALEQPTTPQVHSSEEFNAAIERANAAEERAQAAEERVAQLEALPAATAAHLSPVADGSNTAEEAIAFAARNPTSYHEIVAHFRNQ